MHHPALCVDVQIDKKTNNFPILSQPSFNFKKANFQALYSQLALLDLEFAPGMSVNDTLSVFYEQIYAIFNEHVPQKIPSRKQYPPWFDSYIIRLLRQKDKAWKTYKKSNSVDDYNHFRQLRASLKVSIHNAYNKYIEEAENSIKTDPNKFWSFVNSKQNSTNIPNTMYYKNATLEKPQDIVNAFADFFSDAFINSSEFSPAENLQYNNNILHIREFTENDVINSIKKIKANMTTGPDQIPAFIIRDCAAVLCKPLCIIFNLILKTATFPDKWKESRICPVFKKGNKHDIENHRPITILCNFAKIFEIIIYDYISFHVKNSIIIEQHGFMQGKSTVSNLVCKTQYIAEALDQKGQVDVIYTDFSKAFDRLDHGILLNKLQNFGFSDSLINLFISYLSCRTQFVQYRGFQSILFKQTSGVPQGSILGPLFFVLFINDIIDCLDVCYLLYADDLKLYISIKSEHDCLRLQHNLVLLNTWCVYNHLPLNATKCNVMSFSRKLDPLIFNYNLDNSVLDRPEFVKDLGVIFDSKLTFSKHIEECVAGAYKCLGFILRNSRDFKSLPTLRLLFITFVRSKLEYASIVWNPNYNIHITLLEKVQRRFFKSATFILEGNYPIRGTPQELFLSKFDMCSLLRRRVMCTIIFLYKIINNKINCPSITSLIKYRVPRLTARTSNILMVPTPRTNILASSPLHQICLNYNNIEQRLDIFNCKIADIKNIYLTPV